MSNITIAWLALSFLIGFVIYLLPKLDRFLALGMAVVSAAYAVLIFVEQSPLNIQLLDNFGVTLTVDRLSGFFILINSPYIV